jgi:NAD(P)-dependent dehydrogenase (short-subunit alcohol dehydrogenase family)
MSRIFITGSSDGLGLLAAKMLIAQGHSVVLHARNEKRAAEAFDKVPGAESVLTADLGDLKQIKQLASDVNSLGAFDAVIHNAGVYTASAKEIFTVNVLAPYILTCLIDRPKRLIYLSSDMHLSGHSKSESLTSHIDRITYSDSKLQVLMLCKMVAAKWQEVYSNAVNPGWVPTKMGGKGAPDDLQKGAETQAWLAVSDEEKAKLSGNYFFHKKKSRYNPEADDARLQGLLLTACQQLTGIPFPD